MKSQSSIDVTRSAFCRIDAAPFLADFLSKMITVKLSKRYPDIKACGASEITVAILREELRRSAYSGVIAQIPYLLLSPKHPLWKEDAALLEICNAIIRGGGTSEKGPAPMDRWKFAILCALAYENAPTIEHALAMEGVQGAMGRATEAANRNQPPSEKPIPLIPPVQFRRPPQLYWLDKPTSAEQTCGMRIKHRLNLTCRPEGRQIWERLRSAFRDRYCSNDDFNRELFVGDANQLGWLSFSGVLTDLKEEMLTGSTKPHEVRLLNLLSVMLLGKRILDLLVEAGEDWALYKVTSGCAAGKKAKKAKPPQESAGLPQVQIPHGSAGRSETKFPMLSTELIVGPIKESEPEAVVVCGFEVIDVLEHPLSRAWLSEMKNSKRKQLQILSLHPESEIVKLIAEISPMSEDGIREYLRRNAELLREFAGNRRDIVKLTRSLFVRAFYLDPDEKKRISFINDARIGEFACDHPFLAWTNEEVKERLKIAQTLWRTGEDIVDYSKASAYTQRVDAGE